MRNWMSFFALLAAATFVAPPVTEAQPLASSMHLESWIGMPTQYIFRGMPQKKKGLILQAGSEIRADFYDDDWFEVSVPISFFASAHPMDRVSGSEVPNVPASWYESRFAGGLMLRFGGLVTDGRFLIYSSPNGSFNDIYEMNVDLTYRDEEHWTDGDPKAFFRGINPQIVFARELIGARDGGVSGTYLEVGVAPQVHFFDGGAILGADFLLPVKAGFSLGDYFEIPTSSGGWKDETLGYVSFTPTLDMVARFIPQRLGIWAGGASLDIVLPTAMKNAPGSKVNTAEFVFMGYSRIGF